MSSFPRDDAGGLHKICNQGNLQKLQELVHQIDAVTLQEKLKCRKGVFGFTPLHEVVSGGHSRLLDFLLEKGGDPHCRAASGYTPLHFAASSGDAECVRVLLRHNADVSVTDEYGKTARQTAEMSFKPDVARILRSAEIIKEVQVNGDNLTELLRGTTTDNLEPGCLNEALLAAVDNDNHFSIGKLVIKGAHNIDTCLKLAKEGNKPNARAMLLLVKAAQEGNHPLILKLFDESAPGLQDEEQYHDDNFEDAQKAVCTGRISTVVPIEIARRNGHVIVREELLMKTDVNRMEGTVYWHGLRLRALEVSWLRKISWVQRLRLDRNGFRHLPNEMGLYLLQLQKLSLHHNELTTIPSCILELPSLQELNLAHNKLVDLPTIPEWSHSLRVLDLSHNNLISMANESCAPAIQALNLSHNQFQEVPLCVCSFVSLQSLHIGENPEITILPVEMGKLNNLTRLNLKGLKNLRDPPEHIRDCRECIHYLRRKLHSVEESEVHDKEEDGMKVDQGKKEEATAEPGSTPPAENESSKTVQELLTFPLSAASLSSGEGQTPWCRSD